MSEERQNKIINTLETYFSDSNLLWDKVLQKHISENFEGFVPLEILSRMQKFKALAATPEEIGESAKIRSLTRLKFSPDNKSIGRIKPFTPNKKVEDDEKSIYVEGLSAAYQNDTKIYELFEKHVGLVSFVRVPETKMKNSRFLGFCFIEFFNQENVDKAIKLMDNNPELTRSKLRVMSKIKWNEYEQEYLSLYEERREKIRWLWREDNRKLEKTEDTTQDENPAKKPKLDHSQSFVEGIIAFVQNLHPNCSKTTATELLQTSGVHIAYMANKKKGLDRAHVRLENPEEAVKLETYFKENPVTQETEKDKIGKKNQDHGVDTIKVRVLHGKEEELYWESDSAGKNAIGKKQQ